MTSETGQPGWAPPVDLGIAGIVDAVQIGDGGFARVYRARKLSLNQTVAVKVLKQTLDSASRQRFDREVEAMVALFGQPGIVGILDAGYDSAERPYIVMEYMHGGNLAALLHARGPLGWTDATRIGLELSGALEAAHSARVLHCDVKPENVLFTQSGAVKLGDFGLATLTDRPLDLQYTQNAVSLVYTAPEVVLHNGPRTYGTDVYALAATIMESILGWPPFARPGDDLGRIFNRLESEAPPNLREGGVPDPVCRVLERALAKRPEQRYPTAGEFRRDLQGALGAARVEPQPIPPPPPSPPPQPHPGPSPHSQWEGLGRRLPGPLKRPRNVAAAAVALIVVIVLVIVLVVPKGGGGASAAGAVSQVASPQRLADALASDPMPASEIPASWSSQAEFLNAYQATGLVAAVVNPVSGPAANMYVIYDVFDNAGDANADAHSGLPIPGDYNQAGTFTATGVQDPTTCAIARTTSSSSPPWDWSCDVLSSKVELFAVVEDSSRSDAANESTMDTLLSGAIHHLSTVAASSARGLAAPPGSLNPESLYAQLAGSTTAFPDSLLPGGVSGAPFQQADFSGAPSGLVGESGATYLEVRPTGPSGESVYLEYFIFDNTSDLSGWLSKGLSPATASGTGTGFATNALPSGTQCSNFPGSQDSAWCYAPYGNVVIGAGVTTSATPTAADDALVEALSVGGMMYLDKVDGTLGS